MDQTQKKSNNIFIAPRRIFFRRCSYLATDKKTDKPKRKNNQGSFYYDEATKRYRAALTMEDGKRTSKRFDTEQEAEDWIALKRAEMGLGSFHHQKLNLVHI